MFSSLPQHAHTELAQLIQEYGQPVTENVSLNVTRLFDPLNKKDRYGEVCMMIRRKNGLLLTMTKTYYPAQTYRLPTGGINHGESIFHALLRETHEETGLEVRVARFLAAAAYRLPQRGEAPLFYTFAFLLDELNGTLGSVDEDEQVSDFREIEPAALPALADQLDQLEQQLNPAEIGDLGDWGHFRAVIHRLTWQALQS